MRELPFRARIADSFVKMLKWETAKAIDESPGVLPCLCVEESQRRKTLDPREGQPRRIDFGAGPEIPAINRLAPSTSSRVVVIKERAWVVCFGKRKYPPKATFEIDGLELHISERAQAELSGSTIRVEGDKIVVTYERI
jgi:hypothetical protein